MIKRALFKLFASINEALNEDAKRSSHSMLAVGLVGTLAHCFYGILWTQLTPLENEGVLLRVIGALSCFALLMNRHWPKSWKRFLPWYWFGVVLYSLPFFATLQLFSSNYSVLRSMLEVTMVFFVIIVFCKPAIAICNMLIGVALATGVAALTLPNFTELNHDIFFSVHLHLLVYTSIAGLIFSRSNLKGQLAQEKLDTLMQMTNCIAYEMKNPLLQIQQRLAVIKQRMPFPGSGDKVCTMSGTDAEVIYREMGKSLPAVNRGIQICDMTMDEMGFTTIDPAGFRMIHAGPITRKTVDEYGYQNVAERTGVRVEVPYDFVFKVDEKRYTYILCNLLKNALYYFRSHPDARVVITVDEGTVTVEDTGPGIKPELMERLFQRFHNTDKPGATGLGLSFCHRTMQAFGGRITCSSKPGEPTRFVLHFPTIGAQELKAYESSLMERAATMFKDRPILIVDDATHLRARTRLALAPIEAQFDEAEDGRVAIDMLSRKRYDAVVLDLNMPGLDGFDAAEMIRRGCVPGQEHMTILVHSGASRQRARARLDRIGVDAFVSKGSPQIELIDGLCRAHEAAAQRQHALEAVSSLAEKTLLLADTETFSRKYIRGALQERGMRVIEAKDGQVLMEKLMSGTRIDVVLTDIRMPLIDGIELTRTIRALPHPLCATPVIAMGSQCGDPLLAAAQDVGVDDFLSKPTNLMELFQKLNKHLTVEDPALPQDEPLEPASSQPSALEDPEPTVVAAPPLLDMALLARLRQIGMTLDDMSQGVNKIRIKLNQLEQWTASNEPARLQEVLQMIQEMANQIGARAFLDELHRSFVMQTPQMASEDWSTRLHDLLAETEAVIKANMPQN